MVKIGIVNKKCSICENTPIDIYTSSNWRSFLCVPCMKKHGDTHHKKINGYIPSDYYSLSINQFKGVIK